MQPFPKELLKLGPIAVTDTMLVAILLSAALLALLRFAMLNQAARESLELTYEVLERSILETTNTDTRALVPLILTLWLFIGAANLVGLLPGLSSPTRDLSLAAALALISFGAGHVHALRQQGLRYLKRYVEPSPFLLPFNVIGEISRTLALALRLFGNMLSGALISAIFLYLAGLLIPVPLMLLSALTAVVQAYIFGVLTLVFAASSLESAERQPILSKARKA
ncbi:MAG: F0F1 ATP synthase subunit A [Polyangiaceae bacterium]